MSELKQILLADCSDCGRMVVHNGCCQFCGGRSWLPAGWFNRVRDGKRLVQEVST